MEIVKLAGIFQSTLDHTQHEQAEKQLEQVSINETVFKLNPFMIPIMFSNRCTK